MKYCLNYNKTSKYSDEVAELNIDFNIKDKTLLEFLENHKHQRVNIYFDNSILEECIKYNMIDKFNTLAIERPDLNFAIKFPTYTKLLNKDLKVKFFYQEVITDWDRLIGYMKSGVSDVYIGEELGFELDKVKKVADLYNVKIRTYPNICQTSWTDTDSLKTFFIRPEDISQYENYIDICEFFYDEDKQQDVYYEIYKNEEWFGKLNEIIIGFDNDLDSRFVIPRFAEKRIKCNKICLKGGICQICERIENLSKTLKDADILVTVDKKKKKEDEIDG